MRIAIKVLSIIYIAYGSYAILLGLFAPADDAAAGYTIIGGAMFLGLSIPVLVYLYQTKHLVAPKI